MWPAETRRVAAELPPRTRMKISACQVIGSRGAPCKAGRTVTARPRDTLRAPDLTCRGGQGHGCGGRVPIVIETAEPRLTAVPASGFWLITVPMLLHEWSTTLRTVPSTRPAPAGPGPPGP